MREQAGALGTEPVGRLLWHACAQTTMSVGVYGVYALTNAWFVSRGVGPTALGAVNLVAPVVLLLGAVAGSVGAAGASVVSRALGVGDTGRAARAAGNAFVAFWGCAILIAVAGLVLLDPALGLLGATAATRGYAHDYGQILLAGSLTATGFSSLVRAEGRMRFSTLLWVLPVLTQISLDPLLVFGLRLGVRGAALGTVGGQAVSAGMSVWFFFVQKARPYRVGPGDLRPRVRVLRDLAVLGAPTFLAGAGGTLLAAVANALLAAAGGPVGLAAYALCARIGTFATMPQIGIAQGLQPVAGFNAGRGESERVERATALALRATVGYGCVVFVLLWVLAGPLVSAFTGDPVLRTRAGDTLRVLALLYPLAGVTPLVAARFQAVGRPGPAYLLSAGTIATVRVPLLLGLSRFGSRGILWSFPVAEVVAAALSLLVLRRRGADVQRLSPLLFPLPQMVDRGGQEPVCPP